MISRILPAEFADLAPFVATWALSTERDRHLTLMRHSLSELQPFYDAMLPRMDAIATYLNRFPIDAMPLDAQALFDLAMTFVETAHPIDLSWRTTDIEDSFPASRSNISRRAAGRRSHALTAPRRYCGSNRSSWRI